VYITAYAIAMRAHVRVPKFDKTDGRDASMHRDSPRQSKLPDGRRKAAQFDGSDEHLHFSRAIDLPRRHDELNSQMLVFSAVYFVAKE
jgi:hypothetical protein